MRQKPSRIADSAVAEAVRRTRLSGSERLPSVTSLAAASGVAPVTVMRAIRRLEARGELRTVRRPGTYLLPEAGIGGRPPDTSAIADRRARRWETIAGMLIADINARRYEPGARMPSHKELCARYGTSFLTIKKALRLLTDRKIVVPFHTSYRLSGPEFLPGRSTLVVISPTADLHTISSFTPRAPEFWRCLDRECERADIGIDFYVPGGLLHDISGVRTAADDLMKYTASRSILGFLVCTLHFIDPDTVTAILEMLCATGKPVTVFQETGRRSFSYTDKIRANPLVKIIAVDSSTASGYDMGRFLYGLGHRRVACFMHDDESAWVRSRYHGIIAAFADRGVPDAVAGVSLDLGPSATVYAAAVYEKKPYENLIRAVLDFQNRTEPWSPAEQAPFFTVDALPYIWNRYLGREMAPLFGRVLSDKSISAWVGITDAIAIYALDYLKRNGAKVPAEISVAGFDDSTDAFCYGLTSYNFNAPAVAGRIVSHILSAKRHARSGKKAAICEEMRGLVKIRRSTSSKVY